MTKVVFFHKIKLSLVIWGVSAMALLFGCRASKKVAEKTEIKTEIVTEERKEVQSDWEKFIKNNLNITLEGIEIEFEPPFFSQGTDTCMEGDTLSHATGGAFLGSFKGSAISVGDVLAKANCDFSRNSNSTNATKPKVKMRIGRATIASDTEQVETAKNNEVVETASEVNRDEKTDKHEEVKNPQSENLNAIKWIVFLGVVILLIIIFAKWLKKKGKI